MGRFAVEPAGLGIGHGGSAFDSGMGDDKVAVRAAAGDREVVSRARVLDPVPGLRRGGVLGEAVFFDAVVTGHARFPVSETSRDYIRSSVSPVFTGTVPVFRRLFCRSRCSSCSLPSCGCRRSPCPDWIWCFRAWTAATGPWPNSLVTASGPWGQSGRPAGQD